MLDESLTEAMLAFLPPVPEESAKGVPTVKLVRIVNLPFY